MSWVVVQSRVDLISLVELGRFHPVPPWRVPAFADTTGKKKADVVEYPEEFDHVGLLVNRPPGHSRVALSLVVRRLRFKFCQSRLRTRTRSITSTILPRKIEIASEFLFVL